MATTSQALVDTIGDQQQHSRNKSLMIYAASGFRTDIETLFVKFDETKCLHFNAFSQCFRDMKFSLIFRGRHNDNEMHEFIDECYLEVLSQLVNKDKALSHRICSMYLLYAMYVKQPLDQSMKTRFDVKVRITLDQLIAIRQFVDFCQGKAYLDVCFVWFKLVSKGVDFVYYRYSSLGPSNTRSVNYFMFQNTNSATDKLIVDLKKSIDNRLQSLGDNHNCYTDVKERVFDGKLYPKDQRPNVISTELHKGSTYSINKLVNDFKYLNRKFKGRGRPNLWTPYSTEEEQNVLEESNRRKVQVQKKAIKSKLKSANEAYSNILWSSDIIESFKKAKLKQQLKKTTVKVEPTIQTVKVEPIERNRQSRGRKKETKAKTKVRSKKTNESKRKAKVGKQTKAKKAIKGKAKKQKRKH